MFQFLFRSNGWCTGSSLPSSRASRPLPTSSSRSGRTSHFSFILVSCQPKKYSQAISLFTLKGSVLVKALHKHVMKSTPGVNFMSILLSPFSYKRFCKAFLYLILALKFYWQKIIGAKAAWKMLMKLTPGVYPP